MDLVSALLRTGRQCRNTLAIVDGTRRLSWAAFVERTARAASVYRSFGAEHGKPVAILSYNSATMFEFFFGVPWAGGVICPLNYRLSVSELAEIVEDAAIDALVVDDAFAELGALLGRQVPRLRLIHAGQEPTPNGMTSYEALLAAHAPLPTARCDEADVACLYYSGGTTGKAKGVMLTHANVFANAMNFALATGVDDRDRVLHSGPLFHVAGGSRVFNAGILGACNIIIPRFDAAAVLATIERERVSFISLVPTMIDTILRRPDLADHDLSSLRMILYGAAPIAPTLLERAIATFPGVQFCQAYGQTETAPFATVLAPRHHCFEGPYAGKLRSAGRPVGSVQVRVVDGDDRDLPSGAIGEVIVGGPNVMKGYLGRPELTAAALRGGWMHSGDLGYLDEDGFLFIVDRVKDMIISGGENVYSAEVENAILRHPDVVECAVFGLADDRWGERVHAVVVPRAGAMLDADAVIAHCRELIGAFKLPRSVDIRAAPLPLSSVGKVLKTQLRADHAATAAAATAASS